MIRSMTGFGKAEASLKKHKIIIEIRSLNSKQLDLSIKIPSIYREKESLVRTSVGRKLGRGKVDVFFFIESAEGESQYTLNQTLAIKYLREITQLGEEIGCPPGENALSLVLRMPDVMKAERQEPDEEDWKQIEEALQLAIDQVNLFRIEDALPLEADFRMRCNKILANLKSIEPFEKSRVTAIRERIQRELVEVAGESVIDSNRFEQELIYYLEKLDITEEKVRLEKHCQHFFQTLDAPESEGKKLGFIVQEMGREINTIGSKANEASIQRMVVDMKDELEKIKEQLANIL